MKLTDVKFKRGGIKSAVSFAVAAFLAIATFGLYAPAFADGNYNIEPTGLYATLALGEVFQGDFNIHNNSENTMDYSISVTARDVNSIENLPFEASSNPALIADWIKVETTSGTINAGEAGNVKYTISVPEETVTGGQFALINVSIRENGGEGNATYDATYPIYAEVSEVAWIETDEDGNIINSSKPSDGNIFTKWWLWAIVAGLIVVAGGLAVVFIPKKGAKKASKETPKTNE